MPETPNYSCNNYLNKKGGVKPPGLVCYAYCSYSDRVGYDLGVVTDFEFVVVGDTFATAHKTNGPAEVDTTAEEALERLRRRVSELEQELKAAQQLLDLARYATAYEDLSEADDEEQDV